MGISVCIKQVPANDPREFSLDEATGKPALDGVTPVVNAFDTYAEEMAGTSERSCRRERSDCGIHRR